MLKKILVGLAVLVVALVAVIAMQPSTFQVTRSATVDALSSVVHALINDFHKWEDWSSWAKLDPAMKTTYEGAPAGTGAVYRWVGNSQVGEGRMTILESQPPGVVKIKFDFIKPFASINATEFKIQGAGAGSTVTWTMSGESNFISKAFCLFMGGMDKMIGPDFEKGLTRLKGLAEKKSQDQPERARGRQARANFRCRRSVQSNWGDHGQPAV